MNRKLFALLSVLATAALILAACPAPAAPQAAPAAEQKPAAEATKPAAEAAKPAADAAKPAAIEGDALEAAMAGKLKGTVVTMLGGFTDADEVKFNDTIKPFEAATGIDVQYTGDKSFEASITTRVEGGDAPDIANFPQPGLMARFAATGKLVGCGCHRIPLAAHAPGLPHGNPGNLLVRKYM